MLHPLRASPCPATQSLPAWKPPFSARSSRRTGRHHPRQRPPRAARLHMCRGQEWGRTGLVGGREQRDARARRQAGPSRLGQQVHRHGGAENNPSAFVSFEDRARLTGAHCHEQCDAQPEEGQQERSQPGPAAKPAAQRGGQRQRDEQSVEDCKGMREAQI